MNERTHTDRIHTAWRDRIASEIRDPATYDDLGLSIGPDIRIEAAHVQTPDPSEAHDRPHKPCRYEPIVRSAAEFRKLRSLDPDIPGPGLILALSPDDVPDDLHEDASEPGQPGDVIVYSAPDSGLRAIRPLLIDPLAVAYFSGGDADETEQIREDLVRNGASAAVPGCVDALAMDAAGASAPTTVAWTLLSLSAWMDRLEVRDLSAGGRLERMRILAPVGARPVVDAAVLTVIRDLSSALIRLYSEQNGGPERPASPDLHAVSSRAGIVRSVAPADDAGNLVRATLQAVAASSAGADILSLQPYDVHREPTADSVRLSAGIHRLLRHESRLDRTDHPFAGSYAFETIVRSISDLAWERFVELTRLGSPRESIRSGLLDKWIQADRDGARHPVRVGLDRYVPEREGAAS